LQIGAKRVRIRGSIKTGKQIATGPPHPPDKMIDEVRYYPAQVKEEPLEAEVIKGKVNELRFDLKAGKSGKCRRRREQQLGSGSISPAVIGAPLKTAIRVDPVVNWI